jgi:hypothetical protein
MSKEPSMEAKRPELVVQTEAELVALARHWSEVFWDLVTNHFCEAVSEPPVEACCTTFKMEHYSELIEKITEQDDMKRVNERLAEITSILGEEKAADVRTQVLKSIPVVRWFQVAVEMKTPEEISALLTVYREEKLKNDQPSGRGYVRCVDLERALKAPYEALVKAQAARAIGLEYDQFRFDFGFRDDFEWARFEIMTDYWDESSVEAVVESVREEFREKDPRGWEIFTKGDVSEICAVQEQYYLHFPANTRGCPERSDHPIDWAWIDEEIALHRQGHCRVHGDEDLKSRLERLRRPAGEIK